MRAKGVGESASPRSRKSGVGVSPDSPRQAVRVQPDTWKQLAELRRPLVDCDGNLVAFETFDRVVRRLLAECRADGTSGELPEETHP